MALNFQRGTAAIEEAAKGGKKFQPFTPQINWKDGEEKFIMFLTDIEEVPKVLLHEWIDCGTKKIGDKEYTDWGFFISRKDPAIGEDVDPLEQKGSSPKKRLMAVAVELEPIMDETSGTRARPKGFRVATDEYTRKTEDGDETVVTPVVGVMTQASKNFFKLLVSHSQTEGPIQDTAFKVRRVGGDSETAYAFTPYFDKPVDLTDLFEYIEGVNYLSSDDETWEEVETVLSLEDEQERALGIGAILLNKRLNELADWETYLERTAHIEKIESPYGNDKSSAKKTERPARRSQRSKPTGNASPAPAAKQDRFAEIKRMAEEKKQKRVGAEA